MATNYHKEERDRGLISSAMVCCLPAPRHQSTTSRGGIQSDSFHSAVIYHEPEPTEPTMEFEPAPTTRPRTAHSLAHSTFSFKKRRLTGSEQQRTLGLSALTRPWTSHGASKSRPHISAPMDFRRVDGPTIPPRRGRFRPLELSIYMPSGRLSPLPDFNTDDWDFKTADLSIPQPAVVREWNILDEEEAHLHYPLKSNPLSNSLRDLAQRASSVNERVVSAQSGLGPAISSNDVEMSASAVPYFDDDMPSAVPVADNNQISLLRRHASTNSRPRTPSRSGTPEMTHSHSRSLSDRVRPLRTSGSLRRSKPAEVVDEEIRELNTIVEERRASAMQRTGGNNKPTIVPTRPQHHVPAIAPSMKLRARSETLSDIGSAFSVPLSSNTARPEAGFSTGYSTPLSSPPAAMTKSSRASRLRTWFSRSSSVREATSISSPLSPQTFYLCEPQPDDEAYSAPSSPGASTDSTYAEYSDMESSPRESYPPTTTTGLTTPQSFSPTRELETGETYSPARDSLRSRPSMSQRGGARRVPAYSKRGLSSDTTRTMSSVGTSILGVGATGARGYGRMSHEAEPLPSREQHVGMAF